MPPMSRKCKIRACWHFEADKVLPEATNVLLLLPNFGNEVKAMDEISTLVFSNLFRV